MTDIVMNRSLNVAGRQRFTDELVRDVDPEVAEYLAVQGHARLVKSRGAQIVETAAKAVPATRAAAKRATAKKTAPKRR